MENKVADEHWKLRINFWEDDFSVERGSRNPNFSTLSRMKTQGLFKDIENSHELACNSMKDFFVDQGNVWIAGTRDALWEAFARSPIEDAKMWTETSKSKNQTCQKFNEDVEDKIPIQMSASYNSFSAFFDVLKKGRSIHYCQQPFRSNANINREIVEYFFFGGIQGLKKLMFTPLERRLLSSNIS